MVCRPTAADVNVVALIRERGREVKEFLEKDLSEEGPQRSIVIEATSDQPLLGRLRGVYLATVIAEYFRDQGKHVVLMMDSITRLAHAQREIGLAVGKPPMSKGYPPSVFAMLPRMLERVEPARGGTLTGLYTVLVEGDNLMEPIADSVRSWVDGHIVLTREFASNGHFPAIDVLQSVSQVMADIVQPDIMESARYLKELMALHRDAEDLINLGTDRPGTNARLDLAVGMMDTRTQCLRQSIKEWANLA